MMERFSGRVDRRGDNECWLWRGYIDRGGYGQFWYDKRNRPAHRVAWTLWRGPIPDGLFVCHTCDVPACVNPAHLWLGTSPQNSADMVAKGRAVSPTAEHNKAKTHCKHGHEFTEENTIWIRDGRGRNCRACQIARDKSRTPRHRP